jgi:hypothetical protein
MGTFSTWDLTPWQGTQEDADISCWVVLRSLESVAVWLSDTEMLELLRQIVDEPNCWERWACWYAHTVRLEDMLEDCFIWDNLEYTPFMKATGFGSEGQPIGGGTEGAACIYCQKKARDKFSLLC